MSDKKLGQRKAPTSFHAYVATPAYDGKVECGFAQALAEASFCAPLHQVQITAGVMGNGAFIELCRNIFVKYFLEKYTDATHLFFVDADVKFEARAFIGLVKADLPICAGVYRRRQEPEDYPASWTKHPTEGGLWVENDWLLCDRVPTGFLCIRRDVVEEMAKDAPKLKIHGQDGPVPWLFYTKIDEEGRFVGEDFAFCDDYRKRYGKSIPVWTDFDFVHGGYAGNYHKYLTAKIEEEAKAAKASTSAAA